MAGLLAIPGAAEPPAANGSTAPPHANGSTVFFYIAEGDYAGSALFGQSLETLGRVGLWRGPVVVVSDRPGCIRKEQLPRARSAGLQLLVVETLPKADVIEMKQEKTRVWEHVVAAGLRDARMAIYLDTDVIIGAPVQPFLDMLEKPEHRSWPMLMFRDWGYYFLELQSGLMVTRRSMATNLCLAQWRQELLGSAKQYQIHMDQQALLRTDCAKGGFIIGVLPQDDTLYWHPTADGLEAGKRGTFMHFTNTGFMKYGYGSGGNWHDAIAKYFRQDLGINDPWAKASCPPELPFFGWLTGHR